MKKFSDILTNTMLVMVFLGILVVPISSMGIMRVENTADEVLSVQSVRTKRTLDEVNMPVLESTLSETTATP